MRARTLAGTPRNPPPARDQHANNAPAQSARIRLAHFTRASRAHMHTTTTMHTSTYAFICDTHHHPHSHTHEQTYACCGSVFDCYLRSNFIYCVDRTCVCVLRSRMFFFLSYIKIIRTPLRNTRECNATHTHAQRRCIRITRTNTGGSIRRSIVGFFSQKCASTGRLLLHVDL